MTENRKIFDSLKKEWQQFLLNLVYEGMNQTNAYLNAYPDCTPESARRCASELLTNHDLEEGYKELKAELKEKAQVDASWVLNGLVGLIKEGDKEDKIDINALKGVYNEINKMIGGHAPEKKDITSKGESLNALSDDQVDAKLQALVDAATES